MTEIAVPEPEAVKTALPDPPYDDQALAAYLAEEWDLTPEDAALSVPAVRALLDHLEAAVHEMYDEDRAYYSDIKAKMRTYSAMAEELDRLTAELNMLRPEPQS